MYAEDGYGSAAHEAWLVLMDEEDEAAMLLGDTDHPFTPCGCIARAYGGDCAHTVGPDGE